MNHIGEEAQLQRWIPKDRSELIPWGFFSRAAFQLGHSNPKHKITGPVKEGINDAVRDSMDIINR